MATIAMSNKAMSDESTIEDAVDYASDWDTDGYYVIAQSPGDYIVTDPNWLANLMLLVAGLALTGRRVLVGHCSHQSLGLALCDVESIASGNWLNVRSFDPGKYNKADPDDIKRKTEWYYAPATLSEYKIQFLDIAKKRGILDDLRLAKGYPKTPAAPIFTSARPSTALFGEREAFRHYLLALGHQAGTARKATYQLTKDSFLDYLDSAEKALNAARAKGVLSQRSFRDSFDAHRAAVAMLDSARGAQLAATW